MKISVAVLLVLAFASFFNLFSLSQGDPVWCPAPPMTNLPGPCGADGDEQCFLKFLEVYPASKMPTNVSCNPGPFGATHICTGNIVCDN